MGTKEWLLGQLEMKDCAEFKTLGQDFASIRDVLVKFLEVNDLQKLP